MSWGVKAALAAAVAAIEGACAVVPRGAYSVTATRHVTPNAAFGGLSASEATNLTAWVHFRPAQHPARATALTRAAAVPGSDDFLDSLAEDQPSGVWAAQLDAARGVARVTLSAVGSDAERASAAGVNVDAGRGGASGSYWLGPAQGPLPTEVVFSASAPGLATVRLSVPLSVADADAPLAVAAASVGSADLGV